MPAAVRPSKEEFHELCGAHTTRQIADRYGVGPPAVLKWSRRYGCQPLPGKRGRRKKQPVSTQPYRFCYWVQGGCWWLEEGLFR